MFAWVHTWVTRGRSPPPTGPGALSLDNGISYSHLVWSPSVTWVFEKVHRLFPVIPKTLGSVVKLDPWCGEKLHLGVRATGHAEKSLSFDWLLPLCDQITYHPFTPQN